MSNIYCGVNIDKIPKGKKLGSMEECAKKRQICLYGLRKIDSKTIKNIEKSESKNKLYKQYGKLMGEKNKLNKQISGEKSKIKLSELNKELKELEKNINKVRDKINAMPKRTSSRSTSRRKTR